MNQPIEVIVQQLQNVSAFIKTDDSGNALRLMESILAGNSESYLEQNGLSKLYPQYVKMWQKFNGDGMPFRHIKKAVEVYPSLSADIPETDVSGCSSLQKALEIRRAIEKVLVVDSDNREAHTILENLRRKFITDPQINIKVRDMEIEEKALVTISEPEFIQIESTTRCNINPPCVMCHTQKFRESEIDLEAEVLDIIKNHPPSRHPEKVSLHGGGDPLMLPDLLDTVEKIDKSKTTVMFNTNGLLLTERRAHELIDKGVKQVNVSIDATNAETYKKIRGKDFNKVIRNIKRLNRLKKEKGKRYPEIGICMVLMKENIGEAEAFIRMAHELEASTVVFNKLGRIAKHFLYSIERNGFVFDYNEQMLQHYPLLHDENIYRAVKASKELGIEFFYDGLMRGMSHKMFFTAEFSSRFKKDNTLQETSTEGILCNYPWLDALILYNGDVLTCCHTADYVLGNLKEKPFEYIWNGAKAQEFRYQMLHNSLPDLCCNCHHYQARKREQDEKGEKPA